MDVLEVLKGSLENLKCRSVLVLISLLTISNLVNNFFAEISFSGMILEIIKVLRPLTASSMNVSIDTGPIVLIWPILFFYSNLIAVISFKALYKKEGLKKSILPQKPIKTVVRMSLTEFIWFGALLLSAAILIIPGLLLSASGAPVLGAIFSFIGAIASLIVLPYTATGLLNVFPIVGIEEKSISSAVRESWQSAEGKRIKILISGSIVLLIPAISFPVIFTVESALSATQYKFMGSIVSAIISLVTFSVLTEIYRSSKT
jgi:membrane-anchored glycerophosphoryl diester phosphodiesterase (GDPDase)